jgi:hypothetical protein
MSRHARQQFPRTLSAGAPHAVLGSTPGSVKPTFLTVSKSIVLLRHGYDYPQEHDSPNGYCSLAYPALASFSIGMSGSASFQSVS